MTHHPKSSHRRLHASLPVWEEKEASLGTSGKERGKEEKKELGCFHLGWRDWVTWISSGLRGHYVDVTFMTRQRT